jgi:hypothetical protein
MDEALFNLLQEHAATDEAISEWNMEADSLTTRLRAATGELLKEPDEAWQAAKDLRDSITELGHELYGTCRIGVVSAYESVNWNSHNAGMPISGWRGFVELWFATKP